MVYCFLLCVCMCICSIHAFPKNVNLGVGDIGANSRMPFLDIVSSLDYQLGSLEKKSCEVHVCLGNEIFSIIFQMYILTMGIH